MVAIGFGKHLALPLVPEGPKLTQAQASEVVGYNASALKCKTGIIMKIFQFSCISVHGIYNISASI